MWTNNNDTFPRVDLLTHDRDGRPYPVHNDPPSRHLSPSEAEAIGSLLGSVLGFAIGGMILAVRGILALAWWLVRHGLQRTRAWWHALALVLVLSATLIGCAEYSKNVAKLIGCDPVAVERGYCTTPAPAQEGKR